MGNPKTVGQERAMICQEAEKAKQSKREVRGTWVSCVTNQELFFDFLARRVPKISRRIVWCRVKGETNTRGGTKSKQT